MNLFKKKPEVNEESRTAQLERANKKKSAENKELREELDSAKTRISVLEKEREDVRKVEVQRLKNEDKEALLLAEAEIIAGRKKRLDQREAELDNEENKLKKVSFADGMAEGLRKAHDITKEDRKDAMKVAMVAAASHTPLDTVKEINSVQQLTAGDR